MRGLGDFQRQQMKRGDPRARQVFSHLRQALDLLEDIVNTPYQPREASPPPTPPPSPITKPMVVEPQSPAPLLVSVKEARRLIGVSNTRLYELINDGVLETIQLGKRRLVRYSSLVKLAGN